MAQVYAEVDQFPLHLYRCACGRFLFKARLSPGSLVQIKCRACGEHMTVYIPDVDDGDDIT